MQTKQTKCFKKGLAAASAGAPPASAPCCTHCALLWSPNSEPCPCPTRPRSGRQEPAVELHPAVPALLSFPLGSGGVGAAAPRQQHPRALSWSISPFLAPPHCAKCWKGNFSITAVKLISYLHWMDLLSYPLLLKLEPVVLHRSASRIGLVSRIDCVTCFTLYRPVLQQIYRHSFLCMVPPPVTPDKSSHNAPIAFFEFVVVYI